MQLCPRESQSPGRGVGRGRHERPPAGAGGHGRRVLGDPVLLAAGDVAKCDSQGDEATAALIESRLAPNVTVAMLGDGAYPDGDLAHYQSCYDP